MIDFSPRLQVEVNGMVCAGKKLHELLLDAGNEGVREIAERYVRECQLMSELRHPNITQFMGRLDTSYWSLSPTFP